MNRNSGTNTPSLGVKFFEVLARSLRGLIVFFVFFGALSGAKADGVPDAPVITNQISGRAGVYYTLVGPADPDIIGYEFSVDNKVTWYSANYYSDTNSVFLKDRRTSASDWLMDGDNKERIVNINIRAVNSFGPSDSVDVFDVLLVTEYVRPDRPEYQLGSCRITLFEGNIDGPGSNFHRYWSYDSGGSDSLKLFFHDIRTPDGKASLYFLGGGDDNS